MLTRLGIPKLWREDPERLWLFVRWWMSTVLAPILPSAAYGEDRCPATGGGVVASNHFGTIDPVLIGLYMRRSMYYMAKTELVSLPLAGEVIRWTGAFSVRRGESDRDAVRLARWLVREGHLLGMFAEGTRQHTPHPGPVHPGAVMIAMQEGVPIVPVGIDTYGWRVGNRRPCAVVWGEPVDLSSLPRTGRGYKEGAHVLEEEIHRLWRLAAGAAATGFPEQLENGLRRRRPVPGWRGRPMHGLQPWPNEPWAAEPLGPLYRGGGYYRPV